MVEIKTRHDQPASMAERVSRRLRNSGDPSADVVTKSGDGPTRVFHNIHNPGSAKRHGEVNKGEGNIDGRPFTPTDARRRPTMTTENETIAALQAQIDALKAAQPTPIDPAAEGKWRNLMHQQREDSATRAASTFFSRADHAAMREACPDPQLIVRDHRGAPTGPSQAGASGQITKVSSNAGLPGSNTGWREATPLGPQPGINYVDAQLDAQDRRDRAERVQREEAIRRAAQGRK